jgi:hypothetical protein
LLNFFLKLFKKKKRKPRQLLNNGGEHHHLPAIVAELNAQYFAGQVCADISWFGNQHRSFKRRIVFGSYNQQKKLIKIHRFLSTKEIPYYFVSFIVYHEMLHQLFPPIKRSSRRRYIHHQQFVREEKKFHAYVEAKQFQQKLRESFFKKMS